MTEIINDKVEIKSKTVSEAIHSILTFKMSAKISECINRDYNATLNMKKIVSYLLLHKKRPVNYRRTNQP